MGAAKAILVSDDALAGSDALGTAKVLAAAIEAPGRRPGARRHRVERRLHRHRARADRRLLGLPSVTFAKEVEIADGTVKVQRQTEAGYDEVEARCPPWCR
jgi:electron transfer flavoprotein beta subunit